MFELARDPILHRRNYFGQHVNRTARIEPVTIPGCAFASEQFAALLAREAPEAFRTELRARRDLFYRGVREFAGDVFSGAPPAGAFYAFLRIDPKWAVSAGGSQRGSSSVSWRMVEHLIKNGRIGCVPGVDFGVQGEGYVRFCFARERKELTGALQSMKQLFGVTV